MVKSNQTDIIETKRLILRKFRITDFNDYWENISTTKVDPTYGWKLHTTQKSVMEDLRKDIKQPYMYAIVEKTQNCVIGLINLKRYKKDKLLNMKVGRNCREINYLLNEKYWAQGIMPEALKALVEYAFMTLDIPEIVIRHAEANIASGEMQEELGFKLVDRTKNYCLWGADEQPTACIYRRMTKEEFLQRYVRTSQSPTIDA